MFKKIKGKVKEMSKTMKRKTGSMVPKAGVGSKNKYCNGGKLSKKK